MRIAQLVIVALPQLAVLVRDELAASARGEQGFGSSGPGVSHEPPRLRVSGILHRGDSLVLVRQEKAGRAVLAPARRRRRGGRDDGARARARAAEECGLAG